jgi:hypothetical protein
MIEQPDLLTERFAALTNQLDDSDWPDVRRRARTVPRRWLLIPVAAAIAAIAVGSAFAVYRELVDFFSADPAPERIQLDFESIRALSGDEFEIRRAQVHDGGTCTGSDAGADRRRGAAALGRADARGRRLLSAALRG